MFIFYFIFCYSIALLPLMLLLLLLLLSLFWCMSSTTVGSRANIVVVAHVKRKLRKFFFVAAVCVLYPTSSKVVAAEAASSRWSSACNSNSNRVTKAGRKNIFTAPPHLYRTYIAPEIVGVRHSFAPGEIRGEVIIQPTANVFCSRLGASPPFSRVDLFQ